MLTQSHLLCENSQSWFSLTTPVSAFCYFLWEAFQSLWWFQTQNRAEIYYERTSVETVARFERLYNKSELTEVFTEEYDHEPIGGVRYQLEDALY